MLWELEDVYSVSFNYYTCSPYKWRKNHEKDASHLKNDKDSSNGKRYKKDIEKGDKMKNEKLNNVTTTITFYFYLSYM